MNPKIFSAANTLALLGAFEVLRPGLEGIAKLPDPIRASLVNRCVCGRVISANKRACRKCAEEEIN